MLKSGAPFKEPTFNDQNLRKSLGNQRKGFPGRFLVHRIIKLNSFSVRVRSYLEIKLLTKVYRLTLAGIRWDSSRVHGQRVQAGESW